MLDKRYGRRDAGFTMIELLVVTVILVILAAISIPVFLHHREKAVDASIKSELHSVAEAQEAYYVEARAYFTTLPADVHTSPDTSMTVTISTTESADAYCVVGSNPKATQDWVYVSNDGGLQDKSVQRARVLLTLTVRQLEPNFQGDPMTISAQPAPQDDARDAGFTLIEVIVALALIAIVAAASLTFFVHGTRTITTQQRQQTAVAIANEAMEDAYSRVATSAANGVSGLVVGRTQTEATTAWNAAVTAGVQGLSDAFVAYDTSTSPAPATGTARRRGQAHADHQPVAHGLHRHDPRGSVLPA